MNNPADCQTAQPQVFELDRALLRRLRIIAGFEPGPYVDAYKVLRARLLNRMRESGWTTLGISSPSRQAGTTAVAVNLALSLAMEISQRVLLVDANLRNPGVHRCFGIEPERGLAECLTGQAAPESVLLSPAGFSRLVLLPGTAPRIDSAELLSSPGMAALLAELKRRDPARVILFDMPQAQTADALAFAPLLDGLLLVVDAETTQEEQLAQALALPLGTPILGTVLNKAENRTERV
jgi:Mrp family chromosome partitioning ATPase